MTETHDIARHLLDHVTTAGVLTEAEWLTFKQQHCVPAEQIELTLVLTLQQVLVLGAMQFWHRRFTGFSYPSTYKRDQRTPIGPHELIAARRAASVLRTIVSLADIGAVLNANRQWFGGHH